MDDMGGASSTHGWGGAFSRRSWRSWRSRSRRKANFIKGLEDTGCEDVDCIHKPSGGLLRCRKFRDLSSNYQLVQFEVLTAVVMKSTIFWDTTPCSPLSVNRRFGGISRLHLQGRKTKLSKKPARKQVASRIFFNYQLVNKDFGSCNYCYYYYY
jgi:hypothetical protein